MGLFKKKAAATDAGAGAIDAAEAGGEAVTTAPAHEVAGRASSSGGKLDDAAARTSSAGGGVGGAAAAVGGAVASATEASVSALSVAVLVLWSVAVCGWTGFQIVQNSLVWSQLQYTEFPRQPLRTIANNGYQGIDRTEIKALWVLVAVECVALVCFAALAIALMWVPYMSACRTGKRARRTKRAFLPWFITLVLVAAAWFKLFTLSSAVNKMSYQGTWCTQADSLDLKYAFQSGSPAPPPNCRPAGVNGGLRRTIVYALLTIAFHMLMFFWHQPKGTFGKLFGLVPAALVVALVCIKPVTALMNVNKVQWFFTGRGNFTFTAELIVALIEFLTAVWLSLYMGWATFSLRLIPRFTNTLLSCCGKEYEDVYYDRYVDEEKEAAAQRARSAESLEAGGAGAEATAKRGRRHYSLRAALKALVQQFFYMTQLPAVFGFVSPMITYFALGITSWWIIADIIVGAAMLFLYMLLCAFHRRILAPSRHG